MQNKIAFHHRISVKILAMLLILFSVAIVVVSIINQNNIRHLYEENFTERVLLTNALMATIIDSDDVNHFVELIKGQDEGFRARQVQYYHDRLEYWDLQELGGSEEQLDLLAARMTEFHRELTQLKDERYWQTVDILRELKAVSNSAYLYIMSDTGIKNNDGETLYTFIFDADDDETSFEEAPDVDGLGTSDISQNTILSVYSTKKQMESVEYYNDIYGELYYAYAPIFDDNGEVIAVFGTDLDLGKMNQSIGSGTMLFNSVFVAIVVFMMLILYLMLNRSIVTPLKTLTTTAHQLAEGNIYAATPEGALRQRSEIGVLARAVDDMSKVYQSMISNASSLFAAANIGRLDIRSDDSSFKGDILQFIQQINDTLDATMLYLNSIPESIFIMSKGLDIHFGNSVFEQQFGDMTADDIMTLLLEADDTDNLSALVAARLKQKDNGNGNAVWIDGNCFSVILKEIDLGESAENSVLVIAIDITDLMREKENAQAAAQAKSGFLSRMSHEMRTPMNAIIGMTKIAEDTQDVSKLRYCLATIDTSSRQLLGIINDVLDMSKIEAGKFELESIPMNIEKMLMKVCNIVSDNTEKKQQRFNVVLSRDLDMNYIGDELRLSQVLTNLLSNAIKFTPEQGRITLSVEKVARHSGLPSQKEYNTLRFSVTDSGIGMSDEQMERLWQAFEQADGSVSRKYGGTGLGLAISKNIVEKMDGRIWAESVAGNGSAFIFEVNLERASHQDTVVFDGIRPDDLNLLIIESDSDVRQRFLSIVDSFGMKADSAGTAAQAISLAEAAHGTNRAYDIIFVDYNMPEMSGIEIVQKLSEHVDKNTVIIITTFLEWNRIEPDAARIEVERYITKPLFASSILDAINDVVGSKLKSLDIKSSSTGAALDLSAATILLAEDVDINREIVLALLEDTGITIDCAENGREAVEMFARAPERYGMIFMDIQMPEMDGCTAARTIRAMDIPTAATIPIVAMTANVFREDIDNCLAAGMNDHVGKPIDLADLFAKLTQYLRT